MSYVSSYTLISDDGDWTDGDWTISFSIDVDHPLGWKVVRRFADILNDPSSHGGTSMFVPLPTDEYCPEGRIRWMLQGNVGRLPPKDCANLLASRLPHPIDDPAAWQDVDS